VNVAVFGAGVAGLSAAHELARRGHRDEVYERNDTADGFFRRGRRERDDLPTEYSWHGFGPWYHNTFDLLRQIPAGAESSLYDRVLSRPVEYAAFPNPVDDRLDLVSAAGASALASASRPPRSRLGSSG
jgi:uncharacterized protein with NAD-binding domain and iron-sulfur cluster